MDGGQFSLAENKGKKYIILDFWATWCPPCRAAMPVLEKIAEKYKEKDVIVIAVNQQETPDKIKKFLEQNDLHPTVALDSGSIGNLYEVSALPTMVIIDKEGMIQDYIEGFDPEIEQRLLAVMK
ncbi:TlpA family protein disulfide reductase, partial [bacterium]|nr:TlpA family protein disulfide reductase [bacterium]